MFNVTRSAVGVLLYKVVGNSYVEKRISVRIEHVRHSKCRDDFVKRKKENAIARKEAEAKGLPFNLKRTPALPREAHTITREGNEPVTHYPASYETYI